MSAVRISLHYGVGPKIRALSKEDYEFFRQNMFGSYDLPEDQEKVEDYQVCGKWVCDFEVMIPFLFERQISFDFHAFQGCNRAKGRWDRETPYIQVHNSTPYLFSINRLKVVENCCTDELQGYLNEGWRILAVCPQREQRRPDYVLGKCDPNHEVS